MAGWSRAIIHCEQEETQMVKTVVIGAGVMGASVAHRLAQAGAAVTVLEATRIGGGTSGISFAWTNAHKKPPETQPNIFEIFGSTDLGELIGRVTEDRGHPAAIVVRIDEPSSLDAVAPLPTDGE